MNENNLLPDLHYYNIMNYCVKNDISDPEAFFQKMNDELRNLYSFLERFDLRLPVIIFDVNKIIFEFKEKSNSDIRYLLKFEYDFDNKTYSNNIDDIPSYNKRNLFHKISPIIIFAIQKSGMEKLLVDIRYYNLNPTRRRRIRRR